MNQTPERNSRIRGDRFIPTKVSRALFSGVDNSPNISDASKGYYQALRNELLGEETEKSVFTYEGNTPSRSNHPFSDCDNSPCSEDGLTASSPEPITPRQKLCLASSSSPLPVTPPKYLPKGMEFPVSPNRNVSREKPWKSPSKPYRILDAPGLLDDFYTDILDLGPDRRLCVSLSNQIYLYHIDTATVNNLPYTDEACVTSVKWAGPNTVAIGTTEGSILTIDVTAEKIINRSQPHTHRVGCMAWGHTLHLLASGAQDGTMIWTDIRTNSIASQTIHHSDDVCGLRWSHDGQFLASGSNDNELCVWSTNINDKPLMSHRHNAAVRGLAWSPHTHGLLASGGGASDRRIMFFSTSTGTCINEVNTGSQVCCLHWSNNSNEIVSSHGHQSIDVFIWKYPKLVPHTKLEGHTSRVLWICASTPDGETLVTASGDETIRFWNAFPPRKSSPMKPTSSLLSCISIR